MSFLPEEIGYSRNRSTMEVEAVHKLGKSVFMKIKAYAQDDAQRAPFKILAEDLADNLESVMQVEAKYLEDDKRKYFLKNWRSIYKKELDKERAALAKPFKAQTKADTKQVTFKDMIAPLPKVKAPSPTSLSEDTLHALHQELSPEVAQALANKITLQEQKAAALQQHLQNMRPETMRQCMKAVIAAVNLEFKLDRHKTTYSVQYFVDKCAYNERHIANLPIHSHKFKDYLVLVAEATEGWIQIYQPLHKKIDWVRLLQAEQDAVLFKRVDSFVDNLFNLQPPPPLIDENAISQETVSEDVDQTQTDAAVDADDLKYKSPGAFITDEPREMSASCFKQMNGVSDNENTLMPDLVATPKPAEDDYSEKEEEKVEQSYQVVTYKDEVEDTHAPNYSQASQTDQLWDAVKRTLYQESGVPLVGHTHLYEIFQKLVFDNALQEYQVCLADSYDSFKGNDNDQFALITKRENLPEELVPALLAWEKLFIGVAPCYEAHPFRLNYQQANWLSWHGLCELAEFVSIDPFYLLFLFYKIKVQDAIIFGRKGPTSDFLRTVMDDRAYCAFHQVKFINHWPHIPPQVPPIKFPLGTPQRDAFNKAETFRQQMYLVQNFMQYSQQLLHEESHSSGKKGLLRLPFSLVYYGAYREITHQIPLMTALADPYSVLRALELDTQLQFQQCRKEFAFNCKYYLPALEKDPAFNDIVSVIHQQMKIQISSAAVAFTLVQVLQDLFREIPPPMVKKVRSLLYRGEWNLTGKDVTMQHLFLRKDSQQENKETNEFVRGLDFYNIIKKECKAAITEFIRSHEQDAQEGYDLIDYQHEKVPMLIVECFLCHQQKVDEDVVEAPCCGKYSCYHESCLRKEILNPLHSINKVPVCCLNCDKFIWQSSPENEDEEEKQSIAPEKDEDEEEEKIPQKEPVKKKEKSSTKEEQNQQYDDDRRVARLKRIIVQTQIPCFAGVNVRQYKYALELVEDLHEAAPLEYLSKAFKQFAGKSFNAFTESHHYRYMRSTYHIKAYQRVYTPKEKKRDVKAQEKKKQQQEKKKKTSGKRK